MVAFLISLLLTLTSPTTGDGITTNPKETNKPGDVGTTGGSGTWAEGTHRTLTTAKK